MGRRFQRMMRSIRRTVVGVTALGVVATGLAMFEASLPTSVADQEQVNGWGSESLAEVHKKAGVFSLIGVANACGLGASSCFKCHNGSRADKPESDPEKAPWHAQHAKVNHSCAGCHNGNERIIRKSMAHRKLIANPVSAPEQSCASCHSGGETKEFTQRYLTAISGEK